jgi:hypothetical protein
MVESLRPVLLFLIGCIVIGGVLSRFIYTPIYLHTCQTIRGTSNSGISSSITIIIINLASLRS